MTAAATADPATEPSADACDLHAAVHRPLRALLGDTLSRLGWMSPGDATDVAAVLDRVDAVLALCRRRLQCERDVVHAAVEARQPGGSQRAGAAHEEHLEEIAALEADAALLRTVPAGPHALRLYRRLALFVAASFEQMDAAESTHGALLRSAYGDAGADAVAQRLLAGFDDSERVLLRTWSDRPAGAGAWDTGGPYPPSRREERRMILEIADIRIQPGRNAEFEAAIQHALATVAPQAQGFKGAHVQRGIESPERYVLMIRWETLEDHTVGFRQGPLFAPWRAIIGPFFAQPPVVEHFTLAHET